MAQPDTRTLQQIKRDTEQTRAGLTETVDQLRTSVTETASDIRQRISPDAIKAEVSDYFRSRGNQLMDTVTTAARKNPMQAVAVGASLAYPLLRMARAIPVPILMVGAGLFLAGSKTGEAVTQKASDAAADLADEAMRRAHDLKADFDDKVTAARDYGSAKAADINDAVTARTADLKARAHDLKEGVTAAASRLSSAADEARRRASTLGDSVRDVASDSQDKTASAAGSIVDSASDIASGFSATARDAFDKGMDGFRDTADAARKRSAEATGSVGKTLLNAVEQNPLVVAGIGLLIGGLIAGALPRSDLEDGLVGEASGGIKDRIREATSQGAATAKDIAAGVVGDVARQAQEQGLTPDGFGEALSDLGQRVRKVTEAAVTTAFDPEQMNSQHDGGRGNG